MQVTFSCQSDRAGDSLPLYLGSAAGFNEAIKSGRKEKQKEREKWLSTADKNWHGWI